jgi:hypothetical protein
MSDFSFSRDQDGAPRAGAKDPALADLATFLESDIQDNSQTGGELLERIAGRHAGDAPLEFIGNGWILRYTPESASLRCHGAKEDESVRLPPEKVVQALRDWLEFIA